MSETATAEKEMVAISREELEILRAGTPATVTITAEEYRQLKATAGAGGVDSQVHQRCVARMHELEMLMRREQTEHNEEVATMTAALRKYVNPQQ